MALSEPGALDAVTLDLPAELDRRRHALVATLTHAGGVERDYRYLVPLAEVIGFGGKVMAQRTEAGVEITSTGWQVRVGVESYESPAIWSDNYFDILPGETRSLRIEHGALPRHLWLVAGMGARAAFGDADQVQI